MFRFQWFHVFFFRVVSCNTPPKQTKFLLSIGAMSTGPLIPPGLEAGWWWCWCCWWWWWWWRQLFILEWPIFRGYVNLREYRYWCWCFSSQAWSWFCKYSWQFPSWDPVHRMCLPLHRRGSCADLNVPFGVLAPPKLLGKDAIGTWPMFVRRWFGQGISFPICVICLRFRNDTAINTSHPSKQILDFYSQHFRRNNARILTPTTWPPTIDRYKWTDMGPL